MDAAAAGGSGKHVIPDPSHWPALLRREKAAAYCDASIAAFEREVFVGRMPQPVLFDGKQRWSRAMIDQAIERLSGEHAGDWREKSGLYAGVRGRGR